MFNNAAMWLAKQKVKSALGIFETAKIRLENAQVFLSNVIESIESTIRSNRIQISRIESDNNSLYGDISTVREEQQRLEKVREKLKDLLGE